MISDEQRDRFHTNGFVLGAAVLSEREVEELRGEVQRVIDERDRKDVPQPVLLRNLAADDAPVWQIVNICDASPAFMRLVHNQGIAETIAELMGARTLRLWHDQIQYKPAEKGGVNRWHQDAPLWPTLAPMTQVTAWIALDDVDVENGAMSMVPGSHLWGDHMNYLHTLPDMESIPREFEGRAITVKTCPVAKGHVHFHHALTWHGSGSNRSGRPRRAIALHYMSEQTKFVAAGEHPMKTYIESADGETVRGARFPVVWG